MTDYFSPMTSRLSVFTLADFERALKTFTPTCRVHMTLLLFSKNEEWSKENVDKVITSMQSCVVPERLHVVVSSFNLSLEKGESVLNAFAKNLPVISKEITIDGSMKNDVRLIVKLAQGFGPGALKSFMWMSPTYPRDNSSFLDVERAIGENVIKLHGDFLEYLKLMTGERFYFSVLELTKYVGCLKVLKSFKLEVQTMDTKAYVEICNNMSKSLCVQTLEEIVLLRNHSVYKDKSPETTMSALALFLSNLKKLTVLDLTSNFPLGCQKPAFRPFCNALIDLPIQNLSLAFNKFEVNANQLLRVIEMSKTLKTLDLYGLSFQKNDSQSFTRAFGRSVSLKEVRWECKFPALEFDCMLVNPELHFPLNGGGDEHQRGAWQVRASPSVNAIVLLLHAAGMVKKPNVGKGGKSKTLKEGCARSGEGREGGNGENGRDTKNSIVKKKVDLFGILNMDLIRYLYLFFEQVSESVEQVQIDEEQVETDELEDHTDCYFSDGEWHYYGDQFGDDDNE